MVNLAYGVALAMLARSVDVPWHFIQLGVGAAVAGLGCYAVISHPLRRSDKGAKALIGFMIVLGATSLATWFVSQNYGSLAAIAIMVGISVGFVVGESLIGMRPSLYSLSVDDRAKLGKP